MQKEYQTDLAKRSENSRHIELVSGAPLRLLVGIHVLFGDRTVGATFPHVNLLKSTTTG